MALHSVACIVFYGTIVSGGDGVDEARAFGGSADEGEGRREAPKGGEEAAGPLRLIDPIR